MIKTVGPAPHPGVYPLRTAGSKKQTAVHMPAAYRSVTASVRVALLRCPDYAVTKVLTIHWTIIPFTRLNMQNLQKPKRDDGIPLYPDYVVVHFKNRLHEFLIGGRTVCMGFTCTLHCAANQRMY